jgi:hypothetical protein
MEANWLKGTLLSYPGLGLAIMKKRIEKIFAKVDGYVSLNHVN